MDQYTLDFLQITPKNMRQDKSLVYIIWAMDTCSESDDIDLVRILQKHLRKLFPDWEKIFEKKRIRLDSIELSEKGVQSLRDQGFIYLDEFEKKWGKFLKKELKLPSYFQIPKSDIMRMIVYLDY